MSTTWSWRFLRFRPSTSMRRVLKVSNPTALNAASADRNHIRSTVVDPDECKWSHIWGHSYRGSIRGSCGTVWYATHHEQTSDHFPNPSLRGCKKSSVVHSLLFLQLRVHSADGRIRRITRWSDAFTRRITGKPYGTHLGHMGHMGHTKSSFDLQDTLSVQKYRQLSQWTGFLQSLATFRWQLLIFAYCC